MQMRNRLARISPVVNDKAVAGFFQAGFFRDFRRFEEQVA
jgi:hypothetical protein